MIILTIWQYKSKKIFSIDAAQNIIGIILFLIAVSNIQSLLKLGNAGIFANSINIILSGIIGKVGQWVLNIVLITLSALLTIREEYFIKIVKNIKSKFNFNKNIKSKKQIEENTEYEIYEKKEDIVILGDDLNDNQDNFEEYSELIEVSQQDTNNLKTNDKKEKIQDITQSTEQIKEEPKEKPTIEQKQNTQSIRNKDVEILNEVIENKKLLEELEKGQVQKPKDFSLPPLKFLADSPKRSNNINEAEIDQKISDLLEKLKRFKIEGDVVRTYTGPVVTTFEFRPAPHIKVSKILTLQDDIAMALRAQTIRIQAPIPGKDVVGIEVPNENTQTIYLKEILDSEIYQTSSSPLTLALGKDIVGAPFVTDLKRLPHLLIAGTTGSGKSVGINAMLLGLLYRNSPKTLRLMMIDPKMLEFSIYNDIPHLLTPVITQAKQAITALSNMVAEMERRYAVMSHTRTKNIESYNEKMKNEGGEELPYIVVIIDELADLMMTGGKDVEFYIGRLAQMARASGIHLIVATQRPSVDVVTGVIKANLPSRIAFRVGQKIDSKVILDQTGADSLLGKGDMLASLPGNPAPIRLHAPFASEKEIELVVEFLKAQQQVVYDDKFLQDSNQNSEFGSSSNISGDLDELYEDAKTIILTERKTSISYLQRRLGVGYNRAANIIEQLENMGVLSQPDSRGQREIIGS